MHSLESESLPATAPTVTVPHDLAERLGPFQRAPTAILAVDRNGRILMTNERLERMFRYDTDELLGRPIETLVPAALHARHAELREAFNDYPVTRQMGATRDLFGVSKDGALIPVEIGLATFQVEGQDLVLAFVIDLTQRRKEEEKLRGVADAAANGLLMIDSRGRIVLANGLACSIFGYEQHELLEQSIETLIPERYRTKHGVYRGSYSEKPQPRAMGQGRDLFARRKDGSEFPVELGLTPLEAHDGRFIVATVIDITERKRAEREIHSKNQALSQLNDELTGFAYSVSHDLKAPLSSVRGLTDLALQDLEGGDVASAVESMSRVRNEAQHLALLIEDLLALARADHLEPELRQVDVSAITDQVLGSLDNLAEQRGVRLISTVKPGLVAHSHATRLEQILENLVSNGIRYSDPSKEERWVRISASIQGDELDAAVEDNGLGIPAASQGQVFGMFRRFHGEHADGSGLGLALTKKHVMNLGGLIDFTSSAAGTRFHLRLPHQEERADAQNDRSDR